MDNFSFYIDFMKMMGMMCVLNDDLKFPPWSNNTPIPGDSENYVRPTGRKRQEVRKRFKEAKS